MGDKTKIDWADASWNPITGCRHGCEYCYARRIAERFGLHHTPMFREYTVLNEPVKEGGRIQSYPFDFTPTFHRYRLDIPKRWTRPRTIFVCSMADLFGEWVPDRWIEEVFGACKAAPQHRYLFLTKNPKRYIELMEHGRVPMEKNLWFGATAVTPETEFFFCKTVNTFVSIEPIMAPFEDLGKDRCAVDWVIVGAETGSRKGKVIPKKDWVMELSEKCKADGVPIFMKESLRPIMSDDFRQEFPWQRQEAMRR